MNVLSSEIQALMAIRERQLQIVNSITDAPEGIVSELLLIAECLQQVEVSLASKTDAEFAGSVIWKLTKMNSLHKLESFNTTHPELLPGEVFIQNTDNYDLTRPFYKPYRNVRLGKQAYSRYGKEVYMSKPVFGVLKETNQ